MERFFWITLVTIAVGLIQLLFFKSLELVIILFSINFMVFGLEIGKIRSKRDIVLKLEGLERSFNDIVSNIISPKIIKTEDKRKEIIEWLNKF